MNNMTIEDLPAILPFKDDFIFKTMLTRPGTDLIRNSIISAFTGLKIVSSSLMQNEPPIELSPAEKQIRFDVTCTTDTGKRVNIEMQARRMMSDSLESGDENLRCRSIYYTSKLFLLQSAPQYSELKQTFQIMICDFKVFEDERFLHRFVYSDGELKLHDICCIIYVELPKIRDRLKKPFDDMTDDERWALLIEYIDDERFIPKAVEFAAKEEFSMAMRTLTGFSKDEIVQYNYLQRQIAEMDYQSDKYAMEHAKEFGLKKGLQQGIKQGLQQGLQQGFEQGSQQTKIETALEMFGMGLSLEQIERATKLPLTVIQNLKTDTH